MSRSHENAMLQTLHHLAAEHGVEISEKANGHFQIRGNLLVNYYPFSKAQTAYVDGTKGGRHKVSPLDAIKMALTAPPVVNYQARDKRKGRESRERREWLMNKRGVRHCRWCHCELTIDTSTLEHIIPLARGGLDQPNNWTLACYPCNQDRGRDMPELEAVAYEESPAYHATFRAVAREILPRALFDQIELEARRLQGPLIERTPDDMQRGNTGGQPQPGRESADNIAAALLAGSTCRSADPSHQEPLCIQQPGGAGEDHVAAGLERPSGPDSLGAEPSRYAGHL